MADELLIAQDIYLKSGIHIGTKFKTKDMEKFIYKTRPDGLRIMNLEKIDKQIAIAIKFISQFEPEDILVVSRRENSWKSVQKFGEATGIRTFTGRYPPGVLTNPQHSEYTEAKLLIITDMWPDRNAVKDAIKIGIPILGLCDTNNHVNNIDLVLPCNNKGKKSLGIVFYLLAEGYLKEKGIKPKEKINLDDFVDEQ